MSVFSLWHSVKLAKDAEPITLKDIPVVTCDKAPKDTPYLLPADWTKCPFCGEDISKHAKS